MALWNGRFSEDPHAAVARLSASVRYDRRLADCDLRGSIAHVQMLAAQGILPQAEADAIAAELGRIREEVTAGQFEFRDELEDVHMNIEAALIERLGDTGAKLHAGRSRNDQVNTDMRLYLREEVDRFQKELQGLQTALVDLAYDNRDAILPGFTHLQHAQPVLFAHHLLAYVEMLERDRGRLTDCRDRLNRCPLGAGALAGSTLPLDRHRVAREMGFADILTNSMDAVASRDFVLEFLAALGILATHLSRLAEDVIFWMSQEVAFVELGDAFCTGSSLMPQKKNPDVAELTRGKCGRVVGALTAMLVTVKGLPMTYNRDLQEDKEGLFDAIDTVHLLLAAFAPMMASARIDAPAMLQAASDPALMATDLAEWLVTRGVPFREAHHQVGRYVAWCGKRGVALDRATVEQMQETIPLAEAECLELFRPERSVAARDLPGGTAPIQVHRQIERWRERLAGEGGRA